MKNVFRAYVLAFVGLLVGVIGLHRFYLNLYHTGGAMLFLFAGGVVAMALAYAQLLSPLIAGLVQSGGQVSALPEMNYLNLDPHLRYWFLGGTLSCLASLCWLGVDLIVMSELVEKANNKK